VRDASGREGSVDARVPGGGGQAGVSGPVSASVERLRRLRMRNVAFVALVVVSVGAGALHQMRRSMRNVDAFPLENGRVVVDGIEARIEVRRDDRGVPHVLASTDEDAFFGLGFVHAQDRLAQMLRLRSLARGRSAEVVGKTGLPADRLARTLNLGGLGDAEFERLEPGTRALVEAYVRGVNARIGRVRDGTADPPVALLGQAASIEDWSGGDSVALLKLHSWGLSGVLEVSLVLNDLIERLGGFGASRFFPKGGRPAGSSARDDVTAGVPAAPPENRLVRRRGSIGRNAADAQTGRPYDDPLRAATRLRGRSIGSSAWVIAGSETDSGAPILSADHHLEPTVPSLIYVAHFRGRRVDIAGSTIPGIPVVWSGRNDRLAWASTHARAVTTDLYEEKLGLADANLYYDGRDWRELSRRNEILEVRGGAAEVLDVRGTRHGPLVDGLIPGRSKPLALAWAGARADAVSGLESLLEVARARDVAALHRAFERHEEPPLAFVYAAREGSAGMQVAGWIPQRALVSGMAPLPGRARYFDWGGRIPFDALPRRRLGEGRRWAIAADNAFVLRRGSPKVEWMWRSGARAERIDRLIGEAVKRGKLDAREVSGLQVDIGLDRARALVAAVLELATLGEPPSHEGKEIAGLLRNWDGRAGARNSGSAIYHQLLESLTRKLLEPVLGTALMNRYLALRQADPDQIVFEIVREAAAGTSRDSRWQPEEVARAVRESLSETWFQLSYQLGPNRHRWHWGRLHSLSFAAFAPGGPLGSAGSNFGPFETGGSGATVNAAEYDRTDPFEVRVASTFRLTVDAGALDQALISHAPGQSEHPGHAHFADGVSGWLAGRAKLLPTAPLVIEESSRALLVLEPLQRGSAQ
jgi:penicillin amidase